jgi:cyclophilin family peptidyl-prolyl cis-trans isomerase
MNRTLAVAASLCLFAAGFNQAKAANPVVVMETSKGTIKIELDAEKAPVTVKNFLDYVDDKHYDGLIFHRVIGDFMIQGGGFKPGLGDAKNEDDVQGLEKKTKPPIKNEADNGLSNKKYTIAMARTNKPDSATSQFFINVVDNGDKLDKNDRSAGYAVFGKVVEGQDVVDKIKKAATKEILDGAMKDVPTEEIVIKSVKRADK